MSAVAMSTSWYAKEEWEELRPGSPIKVMGLSRDKYTFIKVACSAEDDSVLWVDVVGGPAGHSQFRSFPPERIALLTGSAHSPRTRAIPIAYQDIADALPAIEAKQLARFMGVSVGTARLIRRGTTIPTEAHWEKLRQLCADVPAEVVEQNRRQRLQSGGYLIEEGDEELFPEGEGEGAAAGASKAAKPANTRRPSAPRAKKGELTPRALQVMEWLGARAGEFTAADVARGVGLDSAMAVSSTLAGLVKQQKVDVVVKDGAKLYVGQGTEVDVSNIKAAPADDRGIGQKMETIVKFVGDHKKPQTAGDIAQGIGAATPMAITALLASMARSGKLATQRIKGKTHYTLPSAD